MAFPLFTVSHCVAGQVFVSSSWFQVSGFRFQSPYPLKPDLLHLLNSFKYLLLATGHPSPLRFRTIHFDLDAIGATSRCDTSHATTSEISCGLMGRPEIFARQSGMPRSDRPTITAVRKA